MNSVVYAGTVVVAALLLAATGFVGTPAGSQQIEPVAFEETLETGLTGVDVRQADAADHAIPRAEVFYAQYEYVVGYYGMEALATALSEERRTEQFGQPLAVFVTDFSAAAPTLTDTGLITLRNSIRLRWIRASDAWYVVDSRARTPGGPAAVPFGNRTAATAFATQYNGSVVDWETLQTGLAARDNAPSRQSAPIERRQAWADDSVEQARQLRSRPVSVTVGEDVATLEAAIERAPPNTTVRIPPGRYETNLTVTKPLTLRGAGSDTVLTGNDNGSVLTARGESIGITSLRITGVGDVGVRQRSGDNDSAWDRKIRLVYGYGDAAIRFADAPHSLVENVTIQTPANGIVALNSPGTVVRNVTIDGSETWEDGFMSVLAMYSRMVVEDSTFHGGRDAVYTHYADGIVVRENEMTGMRYGLHEMYTSNALAVNNTMRRTDAGIIVMTRPTGNVQASNDVRESGIGIATSGTSSFTIENTLVDNRYGLSLGTSRSVYRHNTVVENDMGLRSSTMLPTNSVFENDVLANDQSVGVELGTLNIWAADGRGNYWGSVPGTDRDGDGVVDRIYRPANTVDRSARHSAGSHAIAHAPSLDAVRQFQRSLPGLRQSTVVDPAPLVSPARPDRLAQLNVTAEAQP